MTESGSSYLLGKPDPAEAVAAVSGYHSRFGGYLGYMLYALLTLCVFIVFLLELMKVRPVYFGYCSGSQLCSLAHNSVDCNALNIASIASSFFSSRASSCKWISWTPFILFGLVSLGFYAFSPFQGRFSVDAFSPFFLKVVFGLFKIGIFLGIFLLICLFAPFWVTFSFIGLLSFFLNRLSFVIRLRS